MIDWPDEGFDDEAQSVEAIKAQLLTDEQRLWLYQNNLDVADLLNGRWGGELESEVAAIFAAWNEKLGREEFRL